VSEGNVTRYALRRREPLEVEHEAFFNLLRGRREPDIVTLEQGVRIVEAAEAVLESARCGETVSISSYVAVTE
jgi:predicted dehydrogenase